MPSNQLLAVAVAAICGLVIPAVVDLITTSAFPARLKALLAAILAALAGALTTTNFAPGEKWDSYVLAMLSAFVSAMAAHTTGYSDPIQDATANNGIGAKTTSHPTFAIPAANQPAKRAVTPAAPVEPADPIG